MPLRHRKWKVFLYTQWPMRENNALRIFMAAYKCAVYLTRQHVYSLLFLVSALLTLTQTNITYCTLVREIVDIIINCISSCSFATCTTYICMPTIYIRYKLFNFTAYASEKKIDYIWIISVNLITSSPWIKLSTIYLSVPVPF